MSNVTPWLRFQSAIDAGGLGAPWANPENALDPEILFLEATVGPIGTLFAGQATTTLRVTQPLLDGALPGAGGAASFIFRGVELRFRGRWTGGGSGLRAVPADAIVGPEVRQSLGSLVFPVGSLSTVVKGGPTESLNYDQQDVVSPSFGIQLHGTSTTSSIQGNTLHIASVEARFYWDYAPAPVRRRGRSRAAVVGGIGL